MITSVKLHRYPTAEVLCSQAGQLKGRHTPFLQKNYSLHQAGSHLQMVPGSLQNSGRMLSVRQADSRYRVSSRTFSTRDQHVTLPTGLPPHLFDARW